MQGKNIASVIGAVVLVVLLIGLAGGGMMGWGGMMGPGLTGWGGMMGWGGSDYGTGGIIMGIVMLLVWGLITGGIVLLVVWLVRQAQPAAATNGGKGALDILKDRYARGEITREQYEQMRRDLE
ncbi:MAG: SHOCT domain-containing protein [Dehalococcoidia bacterium]|nr:SHOCT domain-containing protein [Dehalococcoidia bacterium]